jgi:O-antigen/teichoic acid export membrane protein
VLFLLSNPVARIYREPGVSSGVVVLAFNFNLGPFGAVVVALLRRRLDYWSIFRVRVGSALVSATAAVVLALLGFGYMSLAWSALGGVVATVLLCGVHRPAGMPRLPSFARIREVVSFSGQVVATSVIGELSRGIPELAVGKAQSMEAVGLLGRALGLRALVDKVLMSALWSVVLPYFSKVEREQGDLKASYSRVQAYVTGIAWPLLLFLGAAASPMIAVLYGPQWEASVPLVRVICIAGVLGSTLPFFSAVLLSRARPDATLKMQLLCVPIRLVCVIAAAPFGLLAVCIAMVVSSAIDLVVSYGYLRRVTELNWRDVLDGSRRSLAVMVVSGIGPVWIGFMAERTALAPPLALLIASLTAGLGWLAGLYLFKHPVRDEIATIVSRLRRTRGKE